MRAPVRALQAALLSPIAHQQGSMASLSGTALASGTSDALFSAIEKMHLQYRQGSNCGIAERQSWGKFLDAGTGTHSLKWIRELPLESWTAVTADPQMQASVEKEVRRLC